MRHSTRNQKKESGYEIGCDFCFRSQSHGLLLFLPTPSRQGQQENGRTVFGAAFHVHYTLFAHGQPSVVLGSVRMRGLVSSAAHWVRTRNPRRLAALASPPHLSDRARHDHRPVDIGPRTSKHHIFPERRCYGVESIFFDRNCFPWFGLAFWCHRSILSLLRSSMVQTPGRLRRNLIPIFSIVLWQHSDPNRMRALAVRTAVTDIAVNQFATPDFRVQKRFFSSHRPPAGDAGEAPVIQVHQKNSGDAARRRVAPDPRLRQIVEIEQLNLAHILIDDPDNLTPRRRLTTPQSLGDSENCFPDFRLRKHKPQIVETEPKHGFRRHSAA